MNFTNASVYCYRHNPALMNTSNVQNDLDIIQLQKQSKNFPEEFQSQITNIWSLYRNSNKYERLLILKGILALSCTAQLSYISSVIQPMIRVDFTSIFPTEISKHIFSLLDASSLCSAAQVNKRWHQLAEDDALWHHMCEQHINKKCTKCGWALPLLTPKRKRINSAVSAYRQKDNRQQQQQQQAQPTNKRRRCGDSHTIDQPTFTTGSSSTRSDTTISTSPPPSKRVRRWKELYQERLIVERNWRRKEMKLTTLNLSMNSANNTLFSAVADNAPPPLSANRRAINAFQFCEAQNLLITTGTGSEENTIYVWNLETHQLIRTLKGHTRAIRTLQFDDTKLVTGGLDNTIRIWNYHQHPDEDTVRDPCIRILYGSARTMENDHGVGLQLQQQRHTAGGGGGGATNGISNLHFQGHLLAATGYYDKTIQVWNFETGECFRLTGHTGAVNHVRLVEQDGGTCNYKKYHLLSASEDSTIRLWDLEKDRRQCVRVFKGHMASVEMVIPSSPGSPLPLTLLNKRNVSAAATPLNKQLQAENDIILVSSSLDNTIKIWSLLTGECLQTLFGHVHRGIQFLAFDKSVRRLISGSKDGSLKLWDIEPELPMYSLIEGSDDNRGEATDSAAITGVQISDSKIVSTDDEGRLRIWDFSAIDVNSSV